MFEAKLLESAEEMLIPKFWGNIEPIDGLLQSQNSSTPCRRWVQSIKSSWEICVDCDNTALVQSRSEGERFRLKKFMKSELE